MKNKVYHNTTLSDELNTIKDSWTQISKNCNIKRKEKCVIFVLLEIISNILNQVKTQL